MSEMINRVAAAIEATANAWGQSTSRQSPEFKLALARAAVEAMREIPPGLQRFDTANGNLIDWSYPCAYCGGHKFSWQATIDEALK